MLENPPMYARRRTVRALAELRDARVPARARRNPSAAAAVRGDRTVPGSAGCGTAASARAPAMMAWHGVL
jgi:hypothetical protein